MDTVISNRLAKMAVFRVPLCERLLMGVFRRIQNGQGTEEENETYLSPGSYLFFICHGCRRNITELYAQNSAAEKDAGGKYAGFIYSGDRYRRPSLHTGTGE